MLNAKKLIQMYGSDGQWRGYTYKMATAEECSIVYNTQTKILRINYADKNNMPRYAEFSPTKDETR
jgi:hypothetical protein